VLKFYLGQPVTMPPFATLRRAHAGATGVVVGLIHAAEIYLYRVRWPDGEETHGAGGLVPASILQKTIS
jgi:hypothetical protein